MQPAAITLTCLGILSRLLPHPPNFTAVGASALFAGARLERWQAYLVPLLVMTASDPILSAIYGFSAFSRLTPFIYFCFLVNVFIGRRLRATENYLRIGATAFLCSLQFFITTNFFIWVFSTRRYPHTLAGLATCYTMALPFFSRMVIADLVFSLLLFAVHAKLAKAAFPNEQFAQQAL
jgi:hypothetical protein